MLRAETMLGVDGLMLRAKVNIIGHKVKQITIVAEKRFQVGTSCIHSKNMIV